MLWSSWSICSNKLSYAMSYGIYLLPPLHRGATFDVIVSEADLWNELQATIIIGNLRKFSRDVSVLSMFFIFRRFFTASKAM